MLYFLINYSVVMELSVFTAFIVSTAFRPSEFDRREEYFLTALGAYSHKTAVFSFEYGRYRVFAVRAQHTDFRSCGAFGLQFCLYYIDLGAVFRGLLLNIDFSWQFRYLPLIIKNV